MPNPSVLQRCHELIDGGRIRIEKVLIVRNKHVDEVCWHEGAVGDTGKELFRHTSAINTSFCSVELINERDLDRFFQAVAKFPELSESVLKLVLTPNLSMMLVELRAGVGMLQDAKAPGLGIRAASSFGLCMSASSHIL